MRRLAIVLTLVAASPALAQTPAPARPDLVLREIVSGMPRGDAQEIQVLTAVIAPGQSTVFHTHAFPVTVYVLEGTFTLDLEGRETAVIRGGQAMVEPPHVRMTGHNRSATESTRVVIVFVADPGTPFLHPIH